MFGFLKKKIGGLVDKIAGKKEEEPEKKEGPAPKPIEQPEPVSKPIIAVHAGKPASEKEKGAVHEKPEKHEKKPAFKEEKKESPAHKPVPEAKKPEHKLPEAKPEPKPEPKPEAKRAPAPAPKAQEIKKEVPSVPKPVPVDEKPVHVPKPEPKKEEKKEEKHEAKKEPPKKEGKKEEKKEAKVNLSLVTQVKSLFSSEVELGEKDIGSALDGFELELLEGDVAFEVAEQIKEELRRELTGKKVKKSELSQQISSVFFNSIKSIMSENTGKPILEQVKESKVRPMKIMFTGPNGAGKTTTIAKIANLLKNNGYGVAIAAADTFRAAAIEQMEIHGNRLGIKVIKGKYGADPTSVAFDAVNHAKAHGLDVVLIDTAGRQETNTNLLSELKKMVRIINPEIKVYVGESIAGNSVIEQVEAFNKELKLDGIILTKLDCDAKGGTIISISKVTHVPVLYVTVGQGYEDLEEFDADKIAQNIAG